MTERVRIQGLSRLESLELKKAFPGLEVDFETGRTSETEHGELTTVAIIVLTLAGIQALASWMMKDRKNNVIEKRVEVVDASGQRRIETIMIRISESTSQADVVKELGKSLHVDVAGLPS